jgi:hypothetical protein
MWQSPTERATWPRSPIHGGKSISDRKAFYVVEFVRDKVQEKKEEKQGWESCRSRIVYSRQHCYDNCDARAWCPSSPLC